MPVVALPPNVRSIKQRHFSSRRCQVRQRRQDGADAPQTRCRSRRTSCSYGCRVAAVSLQGTQVIKSSRPHRGCSVCSRRQGSISRQRQPLRPTAPSSRRSHAANPTPRVRAYPLTAQSCEVHRPNGASALLPVYRAVGSRSAVTQHSATVQGYVAAGRVHRDALQSLRALLTVARVCAPALPMSPVKQSRTLRSER